MRKTLPTAVTAAIGLALVAPLAAAAQEGDTATLSVLHGVPDLTVDVYVDGQLVFDHMFPNTPMIFPKDIAGGTHQVVVTPSGEAAGGQDVLRETVNIGSGGTFTLSLNHDQNAEGYDTLALDMSAGNYSN